MSTAIDKNSVTDALLWNKQNTIQFKSEKPTTSFRDRRFLLLRSSFLCFLAELGRRVLPCSSLGQQFFYLLQCWRGIKKPIHYPNEGTASRTSTSSFLCEILIDMKLHKKTSSRLTSLADDEGNCRGLLSLTPEPLEPVHMATRWDWTKSWGVPPKQNPAGSTGLVGLVKRFSTSLLNFPEEQFYMKRQEHNPS